MAKRRPPRRRLAPSSGGGGAPRQPRIRRAADPWPLLPAVLAAAVYAGSLEHPFVYDDVQTVVRNPSLEDLSNWRFLLVYNPFRPLVNLSYAFDVALWGRQPFGFHLTSLLLHAATAALFYLLAGALVRDRAARRGEAAPGREAERAVALPAAALFAVHPLMSEAVVYASARSEPLCAVFVLLALLTARRGLLGGGKAPWVLALLCWLLAVSARENGAMLPLALLAYDRLLHPGADEAARRRRLWGLHLPLLALVIAGAVVRLSAYLRLEAGALPRDVGQHLWTELPIYWRYLRLLLWPAGQSLVHPAQRLASPLEPSVLLATAAMLVVAAAAWRLRRRDPLPAFALVWFALFLAPSSFVPIVELMAEHRLYLASCGIFLLAGDGAARLAVWWRRTERRPALLPWLATGLVAATLAGLTVARSRVWADPITLWRDAAAKAPLTWAPHYALGDALRDTHGCAAAVAAYRRAVELLPGDNRARLNLGICLAQLGDYPGAQKSFAEALAVDPRSAAAHANLGRLAQVAGHPQAARRHLEEALALDPDNVPALFNLALLYEQAFADPGAALRLCRELQRRQPALAAAQQCVTRNERRLLGSG